MTKSRSTVAKKSLPGLKRSSSPPLSPVKHEPIEVKRQPPLPEERCFYCETVDWKFGCRCVWPLVKVCERCLGRHLREIGEVVHVPVPAKLCEYVSSEEDFEECRRRAVNLALASEALQKNLERVSQAEKELKAGCNEIISAVVRLRDDTVNDLRRLKSELSSSIQSALKLASESCFLPSPPLVPLPAAIWHFTPETEEELTLFSYSLTTQPVLEKLRYVFTYETGLTQRCVPIVNSTSVRKWHVSRGVLTAAIPLHQTVNIDKTSSWVVKTNGSIISCGRLTPPSREAYEINPLTGGVTVLCPMLRHRSFHGLLQYERKLYAFGGLSSTQLNSCEVMEDNGWRELPSMGRERDSFVPCVLKEVAYIAGGRFTVEIESFDMNREVFTELHFRLPQACRSTSFISSGCLFVFQKRALHRCRLFSSFPMFSSSSLPTACGWTNTPPLFDKSCLFLLNCCRGELAQWSLADQTWRTSPFAY